jgi:hypothetical protein
VRILFDGVSLESSSGPNSFAKQLWKALQIKGHNCTSVTPYDPDIQLTFIQSTIGRKVAPLVLRLDGVWHNSAQNWLQMNQPIAVAFQAADAVIVQSEFDRELVGHYIGNHPNTHVVWNGTSHQEILAVSPLDDSVIDRFDHVWCCAASWRPHKRLRANIEYFLHNTDSDTCLVVAGANPDHIIDHDRIVYMDHVNRGTLLRLYKRAEVFIHLAYLDHCPNVVIDARTAGCTIICSSSGGTKEIAGPNATIVRDAVWNFTPCKLYEPPELDFNDTYVNDMPFSPPTDISVVAHRYATIFEDLLK